MGFLRICCLIPCMSCVSQFWHAWVFRTFAGAFPGTSSCLSQRMKFNSGLVFRFGFPDYVSVRTAATRTSGWNLANSWFLVWPVLLGFVCASGFIVFHSGSDQCFHIPIFNWPGASAAADVSGIHVGCSTPRGDVYRYTYNCIWNYSSTANLYQNLSNQFKSGALGWPRFGKKSFSLDSLLLSGSLRFVKR